MRIFALNPASDAGLAVQAEAAYGTIGSWDTSKVDDMSLLFCASEYEAYYNSQAKDFNEDIVSWAISYVGIM